MSGGFFGFHPDEIEEQDMDRRPWVQIEMEELNARDGHKAQCAWAAGGDCTCGLWAPEPEPEEPGPGISLAGVLYTRDALAAENLDLCIVGYDVDDRPMYGVVALHGAAGCDFDDLDDDLPF